MIKKTENVFFKMSHNSNQPTFTPQCVTSLKFAGKTPKSGCSHLAAEPPFLTTHTHTRASMHAPYCRAEKMIFLLDLAQAQSTHIKKLVIAWKSKEPVAAYIHKVY
jgi:hypothetical protein